MTVRLTTPTHRDDAARAAHEGAHAVTWLCWPLAPGEPPRRIRSIDLDITEETDGGVRFLPVPETPEAAIVATYMAGPVSEFRSGNVGWRNGSGRFDLAAVAEMSGSTVDAVGDVIWSLDRDSPLGQIVRDVETLLADHADTIAKLAGRLRTQVVMTGDEINEWLGDE